MCLQTVRSPQGKQRPPQVARGCDVPLLNDEHLNQSRAATFLWSRKRSNKAAETFKQELKNRLQ